jgi:anti-sigma regulatory factor (Ser/Thr protein kinase)
MKLRLTMRVRDDMREVRCLREIIESTSRIAGFLEPEAAENILAVHEGLANVFAHGSHGDGFEGVTIRVLYETDRLEVLIVDRCDPVAPECVSPRAWDDEKPGGMGIPLMRKIMDTVEHLPRPGRGNVLRMVRRRKGDT